MATSSLSLILRTLICVVLMLSVFVDLDTAAAAVEQTIGERIIVDQESIYPHAFHFDGRWGVS